MDSRGHLYGFIIRKEWEKVQCRGNPFCITKCYTKMAFVHFHKGVPRPPAEPPIAALRDCPDMIASRTSFSPCLSQKWGQICGLTYGRLTGKQKRPFFSKSGVFTHEAHFTNPAGDFLLSKEINWNLLGGRNASLPPGRQCHQRKEPDPDFHDNDNGGRYVDAQVDDIARGRLSTAACPCYDSGKRAQRYGECRR